MRLKERSGQNRNSIAEMIEKKVVNRTITNETAVGSLLLYVKNMEVDSRKRVVEVTRKWRRKSDKKREEYL